jgi:multiple sugar transport system substrate-binding protein
MIIPLDEYMAKSGVTLDEFWPATHSVIIWDGQVYAMPWETDVRVLYYNKAAFREVGLDPESPPQTWDELKEYADLLTSRDSNGRLTRIGFHPNLGNMYWWIFAWQNGATLVDDEGKIELYTPEAVEALEYVKSFLDTYGLRELTSFTSTFGGDAMDPFLIGKVAMVGNNNTFRETILRYAPDMEFGVARLPHNGTPASWSNGFSLEISSQSKNPEAAWRFLSYLMSPEIQAEYAKVNSSLVGSIAGSTDEELMADPSWRVMIDEMGVSRFRPFSLEAPTWYDSSLSPELDAVYQGMKDPDQALRDAQKNYEDEVARWHRTHR